ncbi:Gfo/Idh/MocA family protein [Chakrabartyella piscis]|uniref:Gfo/Idh/MocA family protein n=1 Tax=Chakrabartyella piscis TaxID=2918914 RepID=UPI00295863B0|nr:Gfo/Idh/MocA family oxidoreductase [Chakrabartyella piscis]
MIRYGVVGTGWRSEFYIRIAKNCPDLFSVEKLYTRTEEKAAMLQEKFQIEAVTDFDALVGLDFVVISVIRGAFTPYVKACMERNIPILCETPPAETVEDLKAFYEMVKGYPIQFVEQYVEQPLYNGILKLLAENKIGEVSSINLSALHGYHGASIIKKVLQTEGMPYTITGETVLERVIETKDRGGDVLGGEIQEYERQRATITFANGKRAYYDFAFPQYNSYLRTRHLNIRGTMGEIDDLTVRYINKNGIPCEVDMKRSQLGVYDNKGISLRGIYLGEEVLFENRFAKYPMNDDEIALATLLWKMKDFIATGVPMYSLVDIMEDTHMAILLEQACRIDEKISVDVVEWN